MGEPRPTDSSHHDSLSLSEVSSEKEGSVISHLRSQREISDRGMEEMPSKRLMKKTNSEYGFSGERAGTTARSVGISSVRRGGKMWTQSSSPVGGTEQSEAETLLEWSVGWAEWEGLGEVKVSDMGDRHLVRQWSAFMQNRFRVAEFMYGFS